MKKAKFLLILKSLTNDEFKRLGKYLNSPVFNTNQTIIKLYKTLKPLFPLFNNTILEPERIYKKLFPDAEFSEKRLRNLSSEMLDLCESYLAYINYKNDSFNEKKFLLRELKNRNLNVILEHNSKIIMESFNNISIKNNDDYYNEFTLWEIINDHYKSKSGDRVIGDAQKELDSFINFVVGKLLQLYVNIMTEEVLLQLKYKLIFLDELLMHFSKEFKRYENSINIQILYNRLLLRITRDISYYNTLKDYILDKKLSLGIDIVKNIYHTLINFAVEMERTNKLYFVKEQYILLTQMLEAGLIFTDGLIDVIAFMNYVYVCIQNRKFTEAKLFIKKYQNYLLDIMKEVTISLSFARIYLAEGRYSDSLASIYKLKTTHWYYQLNFRYITFICNYELSQLNALKSAIDSFKYFLSNKKIPVNFQNNCYHFIEIGKDLYRLKTKFDLNLFKKLKKKIETEINTPYSSWFMEKINELNKKGQLKKAALHK